MQKDPDQKEDRHGGNLEAMAAIANRPPEEIVDFSVSINPVGFPEWLKPLLNSQADSLARYPDPAYTTLKEAIARRFGVDCGEITLGNGSSEILYTIPRAIAAVRAILPVPSYTDYARALKLSGVATELFFLNEDRNFSIDLEALERVLKKADKKAPLLIYLGHPNNPTGQPLPAEGIHRLALAYAQCTWVIDESFIDFASDIESFRGQRPANVIVLYSATKILAVPGLRIGFALSHPRIARALADQQPFWSVNSFAAAVLERAMGDTTYIQHSRSLVEHWRRDLVEGLQRLNRFVVYPSTANFLLVKIADSAFSAPDLYEKLLKDYGIAIRDCTCVPGLDRSYFRIGVRQPRENARLLDAIKETIKSSAHAATYTAGDPHG